MGRPTKFSQELADLICDQIATSDKGLRKICAENDISTFSVLKWLKENEDFSIQYARAREMQADYLADQILEIADDKKGDLIMGEFGENGNAANVQRSKLQVEARKWIAAKLKPKKYGEKIDLNATVQNIVIDFKDAE